MSTAVLTKNQLSLKISKGFTLIELLVVISIISLLASVVLVALNSARQKARDAKRVSDLNQISKAFEMYFSDKYSYPTNGAATYGVMANCTGSAGCVGGLVPNYLVKIPTAPTPADNPSGSTACSSAYGGGVGNDYQIAGTSGNLVAYYTITFCIGGTTGSFTTPGIHTLTQGGFQ